MVKKELIIGGFLIGYFYLIWSYLDFYLSIMGESAPFRELYVVNFLGLAVFYLSPILFLLVTIKLKSNLAKILFQIIFLSPNLILAFVTQNYYNKISQSYFLMYCFFIFSLSYLEKKNE